MAKAKEKSKETVVVTETPVATSNKETDAERKVRTDAEHREKRGAGMAAMGCVTKRGDAYFVTVPTLRGKQTAYSVTRADDGTVVCSCEEYSVASIGDSTYRCPHKWAVASALQLKTVVEIEEEPDPLDNIIAELEEAEEKVTTITEETIMKQPQEKVEVPQATPSDDNWFNQLKAPVPAALIKQREGYYDSRLGRKVMLDYVEWHTIVERLNDVLGANWSLDVTEPSGHDTPYCKATITLHTDTGSVSRSGIGTGKDWSELGIKKAASDALKRAAVNYGIAIELYKKEELEVADHEPRGNAPFATSNQQQARPQQQHNTQQNPQFGAANPIAVSLSDLVTAKQLGMIRAISRELGVDDGEECTEVFGNDSSGKPIVSDMLSKKGASAFIQHLQERQKEQGVF